MTEGISVVVELVLGLYHKNLRMVKLVVGLHHECIGSG